MNRNEAKRRATEIVSRMTLEEKASQLRYDAPAIGRLGIPAYNWWNEALHGVARAGTATMFPQAIALAAMFDAPFQKEIAGVIATEGRAKYNAQSTHGDRDIYKGLTFWSPNVNIFRDPRWGRGQETYGEDPYLTARLGVAFVQGLQGDGETMKSCACAKHFAVHSGPESLRHEFDAVASPRDMTETYLYAFEKLVREARVEAVMGAYNRVNGEPACGSKKLLQDILRGEWAFDGHVVSDCWAIRDFHERHHVTDTAPQSAALAIQNGCDLNCGNTYLHLLAAVEEGLVSEAQIERAAVRLFTARYLMGLMDGSPFDAISPLENDTDEHDQFALEAARRSMVLLKNDGLLPLDPEKLSKVAVIGPNADSQSCLAGNYCGTSSRCVTFLEGVRAALKGKARVLYAQGCHLCVDRVEELAQQDDRLSEAVQAAQSADVTLMYLGLDAALEGEEGDIGNQYRSGDKPDLLLPTSQRALLRAVIQVGKPLVIVIASGSALCVEGGNAIIQAWYPGQAGGTALCDLLFGRVSPSGRLPVTFYRSIGDQLPFTDYAMTNRTYRYYMGTPLYPFGYGLSYVRFAYEDARYTGDSVSLRVTNTGNMDADEVVQLYVQPADSPYATPNPRLCAFARVRVPAGASRDVSIAVDEEAFTVVDDAGRRVSGGKRFTFYVGGSQPDARSRALLGTAPLAIAVVRT